MYAEQVTKVQYAGLLVVILLFGWFGWPTPYTSRTAGNSTIRIHRLTGCMDQAGPDGWQRLPNSSDTCMTPAMRKATADAAAQTAKNEAQKVAFASKHAAGEFLLVDQLLKNATAEPMASIGVFYVHAYNPTPCNLLSMKIQLGGREYESESSVFIAPHQTSSFRFQIYDAENIDYSQPWILESIGYETPGTSNGDPSCAYDAITGE